MFMLNGKTAEVADKFKAEVDKAGDIVITIGVIAVAALFVATVALVIGVSNHAR